MTESKKRRHLDIDLIRQAADGRWIDILSTVGDIPAEVLDGRHHPCPKCGGTDRFRLIDEQVGAVLCNACFREQCGDGFAAVQWALGCTFLEAVQRVADHLGIDTKSTTRKSSGGGKTKTAPEKDLKFDDWNEILVALWSRKKPPITPAGVLAVGGRLATYRHSYCVIAIPVVGQAMLPGDNPVGWGLYNRIGEQLPRYAQDGSMDGLVKVKLTYGSQKGVVADIDRLKAATTIWKLEGLSDCLAWYSLPDTPTDHAAFTNAMGAGENPVPWIVQLAVGKTVYVLHDADQPGEDGAAKWTREFAGCAEDVRHVRLPYPIEPTHGKDLRDYLSEGHTYADLRSTAAAAELVRAGEVSLRAVEADDDPHRLARANLDNYQSRQGRTLKYWREEWYIWRGPCWRQIGGKELKAKMTRAVKEEFDRISVERQKAGEENVTAKKVTTQLTSNVLAATSSMCCLSGTVELGTWVADRSARKYISMTNGLLDLDAYMAAKEACILPHAPDWWSVTAMDYPFDPDAKCERWTAILDHNMEQDPERVKLLQEWAGYLLLPNTDWQRFMILEGEGANGKSVYCAGIEAMLGPANCSYVPLELFADKFSKTACLGKLLNICGDTGELDKVAEGNIKAMTSGNPMTWDRKNLSSLNAKPTARLLIACNNRPRFYDRSDGTWRRMLLVPWRIVIPPKERIRGMDKADWWRESGELAGIFLWALDGLVRLYHQCDFTQSELMTEALDDYKLEMNPTKTFLTDHLMAAGDGTVKCSFVYQLYTKWAKDHGNRPLADRQFGKELARAFRGSRRVRLGPASARAWYYTGLRFSQDEVCGEKVGDAALFE